MKIEAGKRYLMANGLVATIMEYQPGKEFPWRGMFGTEFNGGSMSWDDTGEQCNRAAEYALIEEAGTEFDAPEFLDGPVIERDPVEEFERAIDPKPTDQMLGVVGKVSMGRPVAFKSSPSHAQQATELRAALRLLLREVDQYADAGSPLADTLLIAETILQRNTP